MKIVLKAIGSLAGLYALAGAFMFVRTLMTSDAGTAYGASHIAASVAPVCIGLIVCLACFNKALSKSKPK